jgi:hypothetical protein
LVAPSFQDGSGSLCAWATAEVERNEAESKGSIASDESRTRRLTPKEARGADMLGSFHQRRQGL